MDMLGFRSYTPMTKILDRLYLGSFYNAEELAKENPLGIKYILNCTQENLLGMPGQFHILQMNQLDGHEWDPNKVHAAINWIYLALARGERVLVHCHAGISRSPTLVAAYLYTTGWNFDEALHSIRRARPQVMPAPLILSSMRRAFGISPVPEQYRVQ